MSGDQRSLSRAERKEAAYLERLRRDAEASSLGTSATDREIEEIRRWEGSAAAEQALRDRRAQWATPLPKVYRTASAPARPGVAVTAGGIAPTNAFAIVAFVLGIGGGVLGIVFGHIALSQIERTGEAGRGLAIAGLTLGYIAVASIAVWVIVLLALRASI